MSSDVVAEATRWLSELVKIPSVNPLHVGPRSGPGGERALAEAAAGWLADVGATEVVLDTGHADLDRPNVYAVFAGESDRWIGLDVHLDTVGVEHVVGDPFGGDIRDGRVWGRGAVDTKACLAVGLAVLDRMRRDGRRPRHNVVVSGTVAEEAGGLIGAEAFRTWLMGRDLTLDELVIAEPTECTPVFGHKGGLGIDFVVRGTAAHSARPDLAENAIDAAAEIVLAVRAEHERLQGVPATSALGPGTAASTVIRGGEVRNIIPDECSVYVSRRLTFGEEPQAVFDEMLAVARAASPLPVEAVFNGGLRPFYGDPDGTLCRRLSEWTGRPPDVIGLGTNAFRYDGLVAHEMVVFGPGSIAQAHAAEEWCAIDQLAIATDALGRWMSEP